MLNRLAQLRSAAVLLAVVGLAFVAAACGDDDDGADGEVEPITRNPGTPIVIAADEPIIVGVSAALSGGPKGERGREYRDAVIVAVERWKEVNGDQIAGHDIEVHAEDDGCNDSDVAALAAGHLLERTGDDHPQLSGLVGVIGPQCSGGAERAIPIYAEAGIVAISGSATNTSLAEDQRQPGFFFRTAYRNDLEGTLIGLFLAGPEIMIENAYFVDNGGAYGEDLAAAAADVAEAAGVSVTRESISEGTVDFTALVQRIMDADPDFVGYTGYNPEAALLYSQLRDPDVGYEGLFGAGDGAASVSGFIEPVGELSEGVLFAGCTYPLPADFLSTFVDLHGYEPTAAFPAQYADAATILLNAVSAVAVPDPDGRVEIDPIVLRDAVASSVLTDGLSGAITFDDNGDRIPPGVSDLQEFVEQAEAAQDATAYTDLGLIPCQVQDGRLVNLIGPDAGEIRLP